MRRKSITKRTAERLHRAAYDFEDLAARLKSDGFDMEGNSIRALSSTLGNVARLLDEKLGNRS